MRISAMLWLTAISTTGSVQAFTRISHKICAISMEKRLTFCQTILKRLDSISTKNRILIALRINAPVARWSEDNFDDSIADGSYLYTECPTYTTELSQYYLQYKQTQLQVNAFEIPSVISITELNLTDPLKTEIAIDYRDLTTKKHLELTINDFITNKLTMTGEAFISYSRGYYEQLLPLEKECRFQLISHGGWESAKEKQEAIVTQKVFISPHNKQASCTLQ